MLDRAEIGRRIKAARLLRSVHQTKLNRLLAEDGLGVGEAGRLERRALPMTRVRREALTRHLGVPERWFLAESVDEIVGIPDPTQLDRIEARVEAIYALLKPATGDAADEAEPPGGVAADVAPLEEAAGSQSPPAPGQQQTPAAEDEPRSA